MNPQKERKLHFTLLMMWPRSNTSVYFPYPHPAQLQAGTNLVPLTPEATTALGENIQGVWF
jgi:hypothetical protein